MNVEALPYTLLLILAEMSIGSLWVTLWADLRGGVTRGFVMTMALCIAVATWLTWWTATTIDLGATVDGYRIDGGWFNPGNDALLVVLGASVLYMFSAFMGWDPVGRISGIVGSVAGLVTIVAYAGLFAPPTWGYPAILLALLAGTLAMGAVSVSMTWGHWYLTEGALPSWPLRDLSVLLIAAIAFQAIVLLLNLVLPVRESPSPSAPVDVGILANPAFYLRIAVGLIFPGILAVLALRTTAIRAMQSATGLLYIAMGAVFAGEVLSKGLMFLTGKPI
ncbi:MAG: hypothetical protein U5Q44_15300 [Dehalococcoidia bacterium]|nr:hypothetical protein [Dehalococcoidia bacterium]